MYSPPRVTRAAELLPRLNIDPGLALDRALHAGGGLTLRDQLSLMPITWLPPWIPSKPEKRLLTLLPIPPYLFIQIFLRFLRSLRLKVLFHILLHLRQRLTFGYKLDGAIHES